MTRITLKKAAKLRSKLETLFADLSGKIYQTTMTWNVLDGSPDNALKTAENEYGKIFARVSAIMGALGELRSRIGEANSTNGISAKLTLVRLLEQQRGLLEIMARSDIRLTEDQLTIRIDAQKKALESASNYHASQDLRFNILSAETIKIATEELKKAKKTIEILHEEIEEINGTKAIDLPESIRFVAEQEGLL